MKFVVVFVIISAALAVVIGLPQQAKAGENTPPSREVVRNSLEKEIKSENVTCDDPSAACTQFKRNDPNDHLAIYALEACTTIFRKYLCEGKKNGEGFEDVYNDYVKAWKGLRE